MARADSGHTARAYTEEDVARGLRLLARNGGSATRTSKQLAAENFPIPRDTLDYWRKTQFARRYQQIQSEVIAEADERASADAMAIAEKAAEAESALVEATLAQIEDIPAKDLPAAARSLSMVKKENIQVGRLLAERPTEILEHRDPQELFESLARLGILRKRADHESEAAEESD